MKTWKVYLDITESEKKFKMNFILTAVDFWDANKTVLKYVKDKKIKVNFCRITEVL